MGQDVFQKVPTDSGHRFFPSPNGAVPLRVSAVAVGPSSPSAPGTPPPGATSLSGPSPSLAQYECRVIPLSGTTVNGPSPVGVGEGPYRRPPGGERSAEVDVTAQVVGLVHVRSLPDRVDDVLSGPSGCAHID